MTEELQKSVDEQELDLVPVKLHLSPDLNRAFRRCVWSITHETGRDQIEIMNEMVNDFLIKYGC
ncbi:MAG: hypothetical protein OEL66_00490 [Desulfobulbaceae bacterium]|nr:hypothetical protein [Desulfobulbaceae bacterium]